jgi:small-conductance mechanosensitive channel
MDPFDSGAAGEGEFTFSAMQRREQDTARRHATRVSALKEALESRRQNELRQAQEIISLDAENAELHATIERERKANTSLSKELDESETRMRVKERNFGRKLKLLEAETERLQKLIELRTAAAIKSQQNQKKQSGR